MIEMDKQRLLAVLASDERVVLDFYTPSCSTCKAMDAQIEAAELDTPIVKINAEENEDIAAQFGIMRVPQLVLVEGGEEIKRRSGLMDSYALEEWLQQ